MGYIDILPASKRKARTQEILDTIEKANQPKTESTAGSCEDRAANYYKRVLNEAATIRAEVYNNTQAKAKAVNENMHGLRMALLTECFMKLYNESVSQEIGDRYNGVARSYIEKFIESENPIRLIHKMKSGSIMLSEMAQCIEETVKSSCDNCDPDDDDDFEKRDKLLKIDPTTKDRFFDNLNKIVDIEDVADSIKLRVSDAMSSFINTNVSNKSEIEDVINKIKDKASDPNISQGVKEAYEMRANAEISKINHRDKNLVGVLVQNLAEGAMVNPVLNETFTEAGKINFDKILEWVESAYTVLEMLNTAKITRFTPEKIGDIVESFKAV